MFKINNKKLLLFNILILIGITLLIIVNIFILAGSMSAGIFEQALIIVLSFSLGSCMIVFLKKNLEFVKKLKEFCAKYYILNPSSVNQESTIYTIEHAITLLDEIYQQRNYTEALLKQEEITNLQSQINPHFLYNSLEAIRSEAISHNDLIAANMSEALAKYFRYNICKTGDIVTLKEEIDNVENYIKIQKYRFSNRIYYHVFFHVEMEEVIKASIPKLTLQPIIENAIYHGLETRVNGGEVSLHVTATEKRLILVISDNGVGMEKEQLERINEELKNYNYSAIQQYKSVHNGIALANVNQRIKMLFGNQYGLTFSSVKDIGTEVEITIPFIIDE
jgi:Putative regulator of cell autolysis